MKNILKGLIKQEVAESIVNKIKSIFKKKTVVKPKIDDKIIKEF